MSNELAPDLGVNDQTPVEAEPEALDAENQPTATPSEPEKEGEVTEVSEQEAEQPGEVAEAENVKKPKGNKNPLKERIPELVKARNEAQANEAAANKRVEELKERLAVFDIPTTLEPEAFDTDAEYTAALVQQGINKSKQSDLEHEAETIKANADAAKEAKEAAEQAAWSAKVAAVIPEMPDFEAVVSNPSLYVTDQTLSLLRSCDEGPKVAYHMAKNPHLFTKINALPPLDAARELGKLEVQVSAAPQPKLISKAPPPVEILTGAAGSAEVDLSKLTMEEYAKARQG